MNALKNTPHTKSETVKLFASSNWSVVTYFYNFEHVNYGPHFIAPILDSYPPPQIKLQKIIISN